VPGGVGMKYKKRPVIIEAVQWNGRNFKEVRELGDGVGMGVDNYRNKQMFITTLEGNMMASVGDFIIKGVN
jgi:hypothetical protein